VGKSNYSFQKRQKELERKKKKELKRQAKLEKKAAELEEITPSDQDEGENP